MSEPLYSPPPPPAPPPPPGHVVSPASEVQGPAFGLIAVGGVGVLVLLGWSLLNVLGTGASFIPSNVPGAADASQRFAGLIGGAFGVIIALLLAGGYGFVIWAGLQMRQLRKWNAALAASIIIMIPCVGCCCVIGLPVGIWSIYILMKPYVKSAFTA